MPRSFLAVCLACCLSTAESTVARAEHLPNSTAESAASSEPADASACRQYVCGSWRVVESASFQVCGHGSFASLAEAASACEALRRELCHTWLGNASKSDWSPKCQVIVHSSLRSYLSEVPDGASSVGSSLIRVHQGAVTGRRVDVRADRAGWFSGAMPHELTHVVLADRFIERAIPRWADEGIAVLADPMLKQVRHHRDALVAADTRTDFRAVELVSLADYPDERRQAAFYGQSAALVRFFLDRASPSHFVEFLALAGEQGYERALVTTYGIAGLAELELQWQRYQDGEHRVAGYRELAAGQALAAVATGSTTAND